MSSPVSLLFVSRRDNLRSVLAACCLAHVGRGKFTVSSCGMPGAVAREHHPVSLLVLKRAGIPGPSRPPRDWTSLAQRLTRAPEVVVVLDRDAAISLPAFHGSPDTALWPLDDLLARDREPALEEAALLLHGLRRRLDILRNLPMRNVDRHLLRSDLRDLGYS